MRIPLIFAILIVEAACIAAEPKPIARLFDERPEQGMWLLDSGYRGALSKIHHDGDRIVRKEVIELEFTHMRIASSRNQSEPLVREIVVAIAPISEPEKQSYCAPTIALKQLPEFKLLTEMNEISDFEKVFGGTLGSSRSGSGSSWGGEKTVWRSTQTWSGFERCDNDSIRVVFVALNTINPGDGWKIEGKRISEGIFRSTKKPPVLKK